MEIGESPIKIGKVRNGVYWRKYKNGCINIKGIKYFDYSIKDAVKLWRKQNPIPN